MDSHSKTYITTTLVLNAAETNWLHQISQNALTESETQNDNMIRNNFFKATKPIREPYQKNPKPAVGSLSDGIYDESGERKSAIVSTISD